MKFLSLLFCLPIYCLGQTHSETGTSSVKTDFNFSFVLSPTGLHNSADTSKDYLVVSFPGKSQSDLYNAALLYINKMYTSPKDVVSKVDGQSLTINGSAPASIRRNKMHVFDMNYTINFEFKDGKMKMGQPSFNLTYLSDRMIQHLLIVSNNDWAGNLGIYNNKLILKSAMAKNDLEEFFSRYAQAMFQSIGTKNDW